MPKPSGLAGVPDSLSRAMVLGQRTRMLYAHGRAGIAVAVCVSLLAGLSFLTIVPGGLLQGWLVLVLAIGSWRWQTVAKFDRRSPEDADMGAWCLRYTLGSTMTAMVLGGLWWIVAPHASYEARLTFMLVLGCMSVGAASTLGSSFHTFLIYGLSLCLHPMVWNFMQGTAMHSLLGGIVALFVLTLVAVGWTHNRSFLRIMRLRDNNRQLQEHQQRLIDFADLGADLFWESDRDGCFVYLSDGYEPWTGVPVREVLGRRLNDTVGPVFVPSDLAGNGIESFVDHQVSWTHPVSGKTVHMLSSARPILGADGKFEGLRGTVRDATPEFLLSEKLLHQAYHDGLTGLPNRPSFELSLEELLAEEGTGQRCHGICYLDLDQFKVVNDTCGHAAGDALLKAVASEIAGALCEQDSLARLGGDEFGILLVDRDREQAVGAAEEVRQAIEGMRFHWEGSTFNLTGSMGLVLLVEGQGSLAEVLRDADTACYQAKDLGRNRVQVFDREDCGLSERQSEMRWVSRITHALDHGGFHLVAQPIVPLQAGEVHQFGADLHFEILLRLRGKDGALISPGLFLPAAERYHIATRIDRWVVKTVFEWLTDPGTALERIGVCSINLSGHTITDASFLRDLVERLREGTVPGHKLCFEITETVAMDNMDAAVQFIQKVKEFGCTFALDDFGSGSASFGYLRSLPVDYVKIDGVFVRDLIEDTVDFAMVKAINDLAHLMGKKTVAEYVESEELRQKVEAIGVDFAQGYAVGKPASLSSLFAPTTERDPDGMCEGQRAA